MTSPLPSAKNSITDLSPQARHQVLFIWDVHVQGLHPLDLLYPVPSKDYSHCFAFRSIIYYCSWFCILITSFTSYASTIFTKSSLLMFTSFTSYVTKKRRLVGSSGSNFLLSLNLAPSLVIFPCNLEWMWMLFTRNLQLNYLLTHNVNVDSSINTHFGRFGSTPNLYTYQCDQSSNGNNRSLTFTIRTFGVSDTLLMVACQQYSWHKEASLHMHQILLIASNVDFSIITSMGVRLILLIVSIVVFTIFIQTAIIKSSIPFPSYP